MRHELRDMIEAKARDLLFSGACPTWREALAAADQALRCNARSKSTGRRCGARALPGKRKCRVHGGLTPAHRTAQQKEAQRRFAATQPRINGRWTRKADPLQGNASPAPAVSAEEDQHRVDHQGIMSSELAVINAAAEGSAVVIMR